MRLMYENKPENLFIDMPILGNCLDLPDENYIPIIRCMTAAYKTHFTGNKSAGAFNNEVDMRDDNDNNHHSIARTFPLKTSAARCPL